MFEIFLRKGKDQVICYKHFHEVRQKNPTIDIIDLEDNRTLTGMKTIQNPHTTVSCILQGSRW